MLYHRRFDNKNDSKLKIKSKHKFRSITTTYYDNSFNLITFSIKTVAIQFLVLHLDCVSFYKDIIFTLL